LTLPLAPDADNNGAPAPTTPPSEQVAAPAKPKANGKIAPLPTAWLETELASCQRKLAQLQSEHGQALIELATSKSRCSSEQAAAVELRREADSLREAAEIAVRDARLAMAAARSAWNTALLCAGVTVAAGVACALMARSGNSRALA